MSSPDSFFPQDFYRVLDAERTKALSAPSTTQAARLAELASFTNNSRTSLLEVLEAAGHGVVVSSSPPVRIPFGSARGHALLTVSSPASSTPLIVEPNLSEHFTLPRMTGAYENILRALPPVFVGNAAQLRALISWLVARMADTMEELDLEVPPWRTADALYAKFQLGAVFEAIEPPSPLYSRLEAGGG